MLPAMSDIVFGYSEKFPSSTWTTENRDQYTFVSSSPPPPQPPEFLPPQPFMCPPPPLYVPLAPMAQMPYPTPITAMEASEPIYTGVSVAPVANAPAAALSADDAAEDRIPFNEAAGRAFVAPHVRTVEKQTGANSSRRRSSTPKKRPEFHTYGRANTKPVAGGFMYGDYLATHNARAGTSVPLSRRDKASDDIHRAQTHYMEADIRRSVRNRHASADLAAPATGDKLAATNPSAAAAPPPMTAVSPSPNDVPQDARAPRGAYPMLPPYNPANYAPNIPSMHLGYASAGPGGGPPPVPSYMHPCSHPYAPQWMPPPPLGSLAEAPAVAVNAPPAPTVAPPTWAPPTWPLFLPPTAMPPAPTQCFVPDEIGARLDPRRFKFAPHSALRDVPAAGLRTVRRDNLSDGS